jgi:hypothetical protein
MVHARAFSFTDDAVSVSLPSPSSMSGKPVTDKGINGPASVDAALPLFLLRQKQSYWYQTLFQSDPDDPLPDPTSFIWQMCREMLAWETSLSKPPLNNLPVYIRDMFDLELRYSYVYCIAPSARAPVMTDWGRMLIFEHAIAYLDRIYEVAHVPENAAFYTYHDALRVYFMGSQFVAVLRDATDLLLAGNFTKHYPFPPLDPGKPQPPPLPKRFDLEDNLSRSLRALERVELTLQKYGERWDNALDLKGSFELISAEVLANLQARREGALGQAPPQSHSVSTPSMSQQQLHNGGMAPSPPQQHRHA